MKGFVQNSSSDHDLLADAALNNFAGNKTNLEQGCSRLRGIQEVNRSSCSTYVKRKNFSVNPYCISVICQHKTVDVTCSQSAFTLASQELKIKRAIFLNKHCIKRSRRSNAYVLNIVVGFEQH